MVHHHLHHEETPPSPPPRFPRCPGALREDPHRRDGRLMLKVGAWISIKTLLIFVFKALKSEFEKKTDVSESNVVLD